MTFLSIIIPFNKEIRYLKDCLQSLKEENLKDIETIIILNGITKNQRRNTTLNSINNLINEYKDSLNIITISFDENIGVAKARNEGLEIATGEYVYFIDGDDYIYKDGLNKLIKIAKETNSDFINGEKIKTYFIQERFEEEIKKRKDKFLKKETSSDIEFAFELLVLRTKKGIDLLSILHILIKKDIINPINEDEKIRFDENKKYFSDYEFVAKVIDKAKTFKSAEKAFYAKRLCEDEIHSPTLTVELKGTFLHCLFNEYFNTLKIIQKYDDTKKRDALKNEINKKFYNYYFKTFSKKFIESTDDDWRNEYFNNMSIISKEFNLSNAGKDKKEIMALQNLDREELTKRIKFRNLKRKIKKIIKIVKNRNVNSLKLFLYYNFFNNRNVKENRIIFESFRGDFYTDSPKYIYEYLFKNYGNNFEYIIVSNNENAKIPGKCKKVKQFSFKYFYYYATSKYWVINRRQSKRLIKKNDQIILSTWHGTPLKKLGFDIENVYLGPATIKKLYLRDSKKWDYFVSPNNYTTNILKSSFGYNEGELIETGYPRNDILYNYDAITIKNIKNNLNINENKKIILYAPTWREGDVDENDDFKFTLELDLDRMKEEFEDEYIILVRAHYNIARKINLSKYEKFAIDVSSYDDIAELYLISDILITDYSSVFFDFANLKRPMLFFIYDYEQYKNIDRGLYFNMEDTVPGPLLYSTEDVIYSLKNIDQITEDYKEKYESFYNKFCYLEDGNSSKRVVEKVWGKK